MANFALIKNNIVIAVIVVEDKKLLSNGIEVEQLGVNFIKNLNIPYDYDTIKQTFDAGIGFTYDSINNVFISPKPFDNWILENYKWKAPIPYPKTGKSYTWNKNKWKLSIIK